MKRHHWNAGSLLDLLRHVCKESQCGRVLALDEGGAVTDDVGFEVRTPDGHVLEVTVVPRALPWAGSEGRAPRTGRPRGPRRGAAEPAVVADQEARRPQKNWPERWRVINLRRDSTEASLLELLRDACDDDPSIRIVAFQTGGVLTGDPGFEVHTADGRVLEVNVVEM